MLDVRYDIKGVEKMLTTFTKRYPQEVSKAVQDATIYGLRELKTTWNKRTGLSRKSFVHKMRGKFWGQISTNYTPVSVVNYGAKAHTVRPTEGKKFLTIPIGNKALVKSTSRIKAGSLDKLWSMVGVSKTGKLYSKVKNKDLMQVFNDTGIVLARKAKIPALKGTRAIQKRYMPDIKNRLYSNLATAFRRA